MDYNNNIRPVLNNRWKLEGNSLYYYGLRNYPYTLQRIIKLSQHEVEFITTFNGYTTLHELLKSHVLTKMLKRLLSENIIVDVNNVRKIPNSPDEAQYCTNCIANDFIIPGLEFDINGKCALCQADEHIINSISTPIPTLTKNDLFFIKNKDTCNKNRNKSRFDIALMYTGGKDSSFLLYYLAKVCKLRVLACTWTIPFMSPNAKANIKAAKERLKNVEFVERKILPEHLNIMYKTSMQLQKNTCLCPSLAYVIFYPLFVLEQVPYIVSGVEDVQHKNMILNGFIPLNIYKASNSKLLHTLINVLRIITFKPPYKKGQLETLTYLKQLAYKNNFTNNLAKKIFNYQNEMVEYLSTIFNTVPEILNPLVDTLKKIKRSKNIPALVNINLNSISPGGIYNWDSIKKILNKELGWQGTKQSGNDKGLHTSCIVEDGKDHSQFTRFLNMESMIIPFSAVELSSAVTSGNLSREQALDELKKMPGFSTEPPLGYKLMQNYKA